jgi:magnesium-transporting ATPase (P-type)
VHPPKQVGEQRGHVGNKTECAMLGLVLDLGIQKNLMLFGNHHFPGQSYQAIRDEFPEEDIVKVYTFNSMRKSMSTVGNLIYIYEKDGYKVITWLFQVIKMQVQQGVQYRVLTKGASEIVLSKCTWIMGDIGRIEPFNTRFFISNYFGRFII